MRTGASGSRAGAARSRSRSTRPAPVARGPTRTACRSPWRTSRTARPCSSSSAGGRRSGSCSGAADEAPSTSTTKPLVDRVRADGPLLPPLTLALARWVAEHYLAPPALVIRAMLPPGLLERLELVAERTPQPVDRRRWMPSTPTCWTSSWAGRGPARDLAAPDGRAGLLRRLRGLAARDLVTLDWTLLGAGAGPRYERWIRLTASRSCRRGRAGRRGSGRPAGPSGPRQVDALAELAGGSVAADGVPAADVAGRHGTATLASLVRRGLAETGGAGATAPAAGRASAPGRAAAGPRSAELSEPQAAAVDRVASGDRGARPAAAAPRRRDRRRQDRDLRRGDRRVARRRAARRSCSCPRSPWRCRSSIGSGPTSTRASRSSTRASATASAPTSGAASGAARSTSSSGRGWPSSRRSPTSASSSSTRSTTRRTRATGRRGSRRATRRSGSPSWPAPRSSSARRRPRSTASGGRSTGPTTGSCCPSDRPGPRRPSRSSTCAPSWPRATAGLLSRTARRGARRARHRGRRAGDPRAQPARDGVGRAVPRLRPRPGLPGLRAAARLPPGRHDPALPPLRAGDAAGHALPGLRLAADPLPRRRHGAGRARGPREPSGPARRPAGPGRGRTTGSGGAGHRCVRGRRDGRPRRDEPRRQGPRRAGGHARRRRLVRRRPQPARRARRRADLPAAVPGGRAGRAGRPTRPGDPADLPARPPGDPGRGRRRWRDLLRRGARAAPPVRVTAVRPTRQADRRARRTARPPNAKARRWPTGCGSEPASTARRSCGPAPAYIARRNDRWRYNLVLRGADPVGALGGDPGPPWSVDVDPESLL